MKRLFDLVAASILIIVLAPVFFLVAVIVLAKIGYPPFFVQHRPGLNEKMFPMIKFRTMSNARSANGELLPNEQRLDEFGRWLRSTSLDELPELFNVVIGHMSLVGPRPLLEAYLPYYSSEQKRRHDVRPGISGWAQINGRNTLNWSEKFSLDVWYVDNQSLFLDVKILVRTFLKAVRREDITTEEGGFTGRFDDEMRAQGKK